MDNKKIGEFISTLRKSKNMTQKDLADRLGITDKAISKWERGAGCPDIGMLRPLADALDTTVNELLDGEAASIQNTSGAKDLANALEYADQIITIKQNRLGQILAAILTISLFSGIFASMIVNFAVSQRLTWSILVIDGCVMAGALLLPPLIYKARGFFYSLCLLTILIIPFLAVIQSVTSDYGLASGWLWRLGFPIALTWLTIGWLLVFLVFKRRSGALFITFIGTLLCIPGHLITNHTVDLYLGEPDTLFSREFSDLLTTLSLLFAAGIILAVMIHKKQQNKQLYH